MLQEKNILELLHQTVDSTHRKALAGGQFTGASPIDRAKPGSKIVVQTDKNGLPIKNTIELVTYLMRSQIS